MTKFIALVAITSLLALSQLGNFWFTYGVWPKSWMSFAVFYFTGLILGVALQAVLKEE